MFELGHVEKDRTREAMSAWHWNAAARRTIADAARVVSAKQFHARLTMLQDYPE
jgi:hypothetical protein